MHQTSMPGERLHLVVEVLAAVLREVDYRNSKVVFGIHWLADAVVPFVHYNQIELHEMVDYDDMKCFVRAEDCETAVDSLPERC